MSSQPARLFVSSKTSSPVPYASDLARLVLVRATLDPEVSRIAPMDEAVNVTRAPGGVAIVHDGTDSRRLLRVVEDGSARPDASASEMAFSRLDMLARADALDSVWGCRRRYVPAGDQVRVLYALAENGESPLIEVASAARASADGVAVVLAMACKGLVSLDLDGPLCPETRVRRCPAAS